MKTDLCNKNCGDCPLMKHEHSKMITKILNRLHNKIGAEVIEIVNEYCPNLTCCYNCHIDDFCHFKNCDLN